MPENLQGLSKTLSVAIPVLNFGDFLPATLQSILSQDFGNEVEVLVFDGGSIDSTRSYMKSLIKKSPNVRYVRALKAAGIDLDLSRSIDLTNAQYCWLFSGDDIMHENGLKRVLNAIELYKPDLILMRHNECDIEMNHVSEWPVLNAACDSLFNLALESIRHDYLELAQTSEAFFSFMGGLVIRRENWISSEVNPGSIGSNWAHVSRIWNAISKKENFLCCYLDEPILDRRGGNDSFSKDGGLSRLDIQINGLLNTMEEVFARNSPEVKSLKRAISNEVFPNWVAAVENELINQFAPENHRHRLSQMISRIS